METWHIHVEGQVQGVGFRPFVYLLARDFKLPGWVLNGMDGVHIEINASESNAHAFMTSLVNRAPRLSHIQRLTINKVEFRGFDSFQILHSESDGKPNLILTPDFGICPDCRAELFSAPDPRFGYPFITCTNCGPRYSIIRSLPYDRHTTTMLPFQMCSRCQAEYDDPENRRYYSQTNSCPDCAIQLKIRDNMLQEPAGDPLDLVLQAWEDGKIVAIKGIGGFLLTCDASRPDAIRTLRLRKKRPTKPFALMYPDWSQLQADVIGDDAVWKWMQGPQAPIVLLPLREKNDHRVCSDLIAPSLDQLGVMLPYAPLYQLLLHKFGKPIVATSGNISGAPIIFQDQKAKEELIPIADFILTHDRDIVIPQDDSVVKFSPQSRQKIILRRSRGLAPTLILPDASFPEKTVLATGAMLKSTFTLLHQRNPYISQYLGDLENYETELHFQKTLQHFLNVFDTQPEFVLVDKHPLYPSTRLGKDLARSWNVPWKEYQHHQAHFASVCLEHGLLSISEPVLGVIWDGTGMGDDGQIWGGEFFVFEKGHFSRQGHLDYFPMILGDKMPREPRISALSLFHQHPDGRSLLRDKFSKTEWQVYEQLLGKEITLRTSSMGRFFDAVASMLGIMDKASYEGEAAMLLETCAASFFRTENAGFKSWYGQESSQPWRMEWSVWLDAILFDLKKGRSVGYMAAKFHFSLAKAVERLADAQGFHHIAFSGGVFQNSLLVDLMIQVLGRRHTLYFNKELSPNDESVSLGQLACWMLDS